MIACASVFYLVITMCGDRKWLRAYEYYLLASCLVAVWDVVEWTFPRTHSYIRGTLHIYGTSCHETYSFNYCSLQRMLPRTRLSLKNMPCTSNFTTGAVWYLFDHPTRSACIRLGTWWASNLIESPVTWYCNTQQASWKTFICVRQIYNYGNDRRPIRHCVTWNAGVTRQ